MEIKEYRIEYAGKKSISLLLPVFSAEESFWECARMNRFYASVADACVRAAEELFRSTEKRARYYGSYAAVEENGRISVTLTLSYSEQGCPSRRRQITHLWRNGYIVKTVNPQQ